MKSFILVSMLLLSFSVFAEQKEDVKDCDRGCGQKQAANIDSSDLSTEEVETAEAKAAATKPKAAKGQ